MKTKVVGIHVNNILIEGELGWVAGNEPDGLY